MRKYVNCSGCVKIGCAVMLCVCFMLYINWDYVNQTPTKRLNFTMRQGDGFSHILPNLQNLTNFSRNEHKVYNRWEWQYDLRIIVIVYNRASSMLRLLKSLNEAEYYGDDIKVEVWIDRSVDGNVDSLTLQSANGFEFKHGEYEVIPHPKHVGIFGQWLSTWKVWHNSSEIAVILEDDLTVSPYFYKYLKEVHLKYDGNPQINGYALQSVSIIHGTGGGMLEGPKGSNVFLYPVIGTWGFSPSSRNWAKFISWFTEHYKDKNFEPLVPGNVVTDWYKTFKKQGKTGGMWSIWHIYYAWENKEYTLYSNFEGHLGLTVNWREAGLHYTALESKPSNKLLPDWKTEYEILPDNPLHLNVYGKLEN